MRVLTNILYIKIPLIDPDRLLTRMLRYLWFIFTVAVSAIQHWRHAVRRHAGGDQFRCLLGEIAVQARVLQRSADRGLLVVALSIVKVIHEFGHGLSCKAFGGEVHEMGALFMVFSPCLYCNVSDAWSMPNKWKRMIISGAGIYVELLIASWRLSSGGTRLRIRSSTTSASAS